MIAARLTIFASVFIGVLSFGPRTLSNGELTLFIIIVVILALMDFVEVGNQVK
jgi:hypothetical protein